MFEAINTYVIGLASVFPIELFALVASFLEEIIAPIPSPLIGTLLGSLALASGNGSILFLAWIAFLTALGKTIACGVIYWAVSHAGEAVVERFGKYVGIKHEDLIAVSSYFTGSPRDYLLLIGLRAVPFIPSLPVSIAAGLIRTPFRFYSIATLIGSFIRSFLFIYVGYAGLSAYFELTRHLANVESLVLLGVTAVAIGIVVGLYFTQARKPKAD